LLATLRFTVLLALLGRVVRRPSLLPALLFAAWRFRARGWYRRPPFLPFPPRRYLDWRFWTAYGGKAERLPSTDELHRYLRWTRRMDEPLDKDRLYRD
jgi:hypothetical protein